MGADLSTFLVFRPKSATKKDLCLHYCGAKLTHCFRAPESSAAPKSCCFLSPGRIAPPPAPRASPPRPPARGSRAARGQRIEVQLRGLGFRSGDRLTLGGCQAAATGANRSVAFLRVRWWPHRGETLGGGVFMLLCWGCVFV